MVENISDTQAAVSAGRAATTAANRIHHIEHPLDPKIRIPVSIDDEGTVTQIDTSELDAAYAARPRAGTVRLTEVDSLIALVNRLGSDRTVVYADTAALSLTAVLDDHPADPHTTAPRQHRAVYTCPRSPEWKAWTAVDGKPLSQSELGDLIEARLEDLKSGPNMPAPTEVLAVARQLTIKTKGTFQRDINPTTGDHILVCKTETETGSTAIPRAFLLAIPVFEGDVRDEVEVRVRMTMSEGRPVFTLLLHRRAEIELQAFATVRAKVAADTKRLVLAGTP